MAKVKIKKCPTCGTENDFYAQSCKVCGRKLRELALVKICPSCLSTNSVDDQFCTVCGISLGDVIGSQLLVHEKLPQTDLPERELVPEDEVAHNLFPAHSLFSINNSKKVCPGCSFTNDVYTRVCVNCGKSLAGVSPVAENIQESSTKKSSVPPKGNVVAGAFSGTGSYANSTKTTTSKRKPIIFTALILGILAVLLLVLIPYLFSLKTNIPPPIVKTTPGSTTSLPSLGEFKAQNGELLGINDGSFPPFVQGANGQLKQQAADQLRQGHNSQAISLWQAALHISNNDAEAWIYLENQLVLLSGQPYITLVAGTDLFESSGSGQSDLQGIYVAQHEFNNANHGFRLRILIANSGTDINNVTTVAQQIVHVATKDKTVMGVISWLSSAANITALPLLSAAHIPMISPAASSDLLTNSSPFFFRIVPPNKVQGKETALFAEHALHAQKVVIFLDNNDPYSQNLAQVFEKQFRQDGRNILKEEFFTTDHTDNIGNLIQDALKTNPDLLYFTSRDTSDVIHFQDALPTTGLFAQLPAIAGDSGYVIHPSGYGRWYFASFAFANAAENAIGTSSPSFYQDYSDDFNEDGHKPAGYYGYTRPDDIAMLSYDVTSVFLKAMQLAITNNKITVTSDSLQLVTPALLANTLPDVVLQGVTGQIAFGSDHDPINKAIVFLAGTSKGLYMKDWRGCFTKDICRA